MSVCLSDDNFRKLCCRKFIFAPPAYLQGVQVKFVYEGHWVKVKVRSKKVHKNRAHADSYEANSAERIPANIDHTSLVLAT